MLVPVGTGYFKSALGVNHTIGTFQSSKIERCPEINVFGRCNLEIDTRHDAGKFDIIVFDEGATDTLVTSEVPEKVGGTGTDANFILHLRVQA